MSLDLKINSSLSSLIKKKLNKTFPLKSSFNQFEKKLRRQKTKKMNVALFVSINDGIIEMKSANIKSRKPALSRNKNLSCNLKMPMYEQTKKLIMLKSLYKNILSGCSLFPQFLLKVFTEVKLPLNYFQFFSFCKHFIRNCIHLSE